MDSIVAWLQVKLGPVTFGALAGFVLQVFISRPNDWKVAAERAIAAFLMSIIFALPLAQWMQDVAGIDRDYAITVAATLCAIGGIELLRKARTGLFRVLDKATGKDEND